MKKLESGVLKMGNTMAYSKCYNEKCNNVFTQTKEQCPYSNTCPDFYAVGFGSAKKKTNFDHIREDFTAEKFAEMFSRTGCPNHADFEDCTFVGGCKQCWLNWLNSEYHN